MMLSEADGRIRLSGFSTDVFTPKAPATSHNIVDEQSITDSEQAKHRVKLQFQPPEIRKMLKKVADGG